MVVPLPLVSQTPPALRLHPQSTVFSGELHPGAGHDMLDALVNRPWRGNVVKAKVMVNCY